MRITKKLNITLILVLVCLVLVIGVTYAWLTIALRPEVQRLETNVGANGSLEIALLTEETFADPTLIKTVVGDSAVVQDVIESNVSWGNVIQLGDGYGLEEITLLPARLNVKGSEQGSLLIDSSLLKTAGFGIDGRIRILRDDTVSTTWTSEWDRGDFTYYVDGPRYGVRAIGTSSNLTAQQTALAASRALVPAYTSAALRASQNTWRELGDDMMDILYRHYALDQSEDFTKEDAETVRRFSEGLKEAAEYLMDAMHQSVIGVAAANMAEEPAFESFYDQVMDPANRGKISGLMWFGEWDKGPYEELIKTLEDTEALLRDAQDAVLKSHALSMERQWDDIMEVLYLLMRPDHVYLGNRHLAQPDAFDQLTKDNELIISPDAGVMGKIADYTGNFSAYTVWKDDINVEAVTASVVEKGILIRNQELLESIQASAGGWTRANMDDLYAFAVDLAFRCNMPCELLIQTKAEMRVEDDSEFPVTQGSGSFMKFHSDNMDYDQLINLMNTLRVGFLSDRGELLAMAKLDLSKSTEEEGEIFAPLYLYEYELTEDGSIAIIRKSDSSIIRDLPQNSPAIVTVVVWMDGDSVDNSMVSERAQQSMSGVLNLQFSSSADLIPSKQLIDRN